MRKYIMRIIVILCLCAIAFGAFDKDKPASSTSLRSSNPEILANWSALETSFNAFHEFSTGGSNTGENLSIKFNTPISTPTNAANKSWLYEKDVSAVVELHWLDESGNELQMTSGGDLYSSAGLTVTSASTFNGNITLGAGDDLIGSSTSDVNFGSGKFAVAGATGNTIVAGTFDVTGNIDPTTYETTNGGFLDEDDLTSDSSTSIASQQSIKAYADTLGGSGEGFIKAWVKFSTNGTISDSFNVTSVNQTDTGKYTIAWDTDFANGDYVVLATIGANSGMVQWNSITAGTVQIWTYNASGTLADRGCGVIAIGTQ